MAMIVAFGEMLIDFVPDVAGVSLAESNGFLKAPGGAPANVACAITKLGGKSAFLGKAKIFHYGSISLISEPCRSAHMAAMKAAKSAGVLLSYDPNVRLPLWPSADAARDGIKSIWNEADFIKVSDDEVEFLTKGSADKEEVVMSLWHDKLKLLVVTDGPKGCRYFTKNFKGSVGGYSVKAVDTTGAGDAFVGSFLVSVAKDPSIFENEEKLKEALAFSNACGAICTTQKGAIPALPTSNDALALMKTK
ncbi:Probable fructokinase-5 [Linum perenne]